METQNKTSKGIAIFFALIGLVIIFLFKGLPLINAFTLPFTQHRYIAVKKAFVSQWVGLTNFKNLFGSYEFWNILNNTLMLNISCILTVAILSFAIAVALSYVKNTGVYKGFIIFFIIPFFVPKVLWSVLISNLFSSEPILYMQQLNAVRMMYIVIETIRWTGIVAGLIAFAARRVSQQERIPTALKAVVAILLICIAFVFVTDFELLHSLINSNVSKKMYTLALYIFSKGLVSSEYGLSSSVWLLQFLFSLVVLLVLFICARSYIKNALFPPKNNEIASSLSKQSDMNFLKVIPALYSLFLVVVVGLLIYTMLGIGDIILTPDFLKSVVIYFLLAVISSSISIGLSILLAYPLTNASLGLRKSYMIIVIMLIAASQFGIHEYFYMRTLGVMDTYFAIILSNMFNPIYVLIIGVYYNQKTQGAVASFGEFIKNSIPVILCLFMASVLLNMDSYSSSLIYIKEPSKLAPTLQIYMDYFNIK